MTATALSANPKEYRARLADQADDQIDAWVAELMRDVVIRRGIVKVVADFQRAARLDDRGFERVFASGGGPPAVIGRDAQGRLVVPTITLFALVPGIRAQVPDARDAADRIPGRELRRDRLRLIPRSGRGRVGGPDPSTGSVAWSVSPIPFPVCSTAWSRAPWRCWPAPMR